MGQIVCSRCGKGIKVAGNLRKYTAPIAVTPGKSAPRFLKFLCEDCKAIVIRKAYGRLQEKALREKVEELKKK
jgi:hypothetical protein